MQMGMPLDDFIAMDGGTGLMQKADSLDELAVLLGFEGEAKQRLMDTIAHYNDIVESGVDTDYGKEPTASRRLSSRPSTAAVRGALLTTLDGLRINEDMAGAHR